MSLYHSVTVNPDDPKFQPVIVEVNNIDWKDEYFRKRQNKNRIIFLLSIVAISCCVAFLWTNGASIKHWQNTGSLKIIYGTPFPPKPLDQTTSSTHPTTPTSPLFCYKPRFVAYYSGIGRRAFTQSQISKLTHIIFSYLNLKSDGSVSFRNQNEKRRFLDFKEKIKSKNPDVKLMVSIDDNGSYFQFSEVSENAIKRKNFRESLSEFLLSNNLDGVDLNWRFPFQEDLRNQVKLVQELKEHLTRLAKETGRANPHLISLAAPALGKTPNNEIGENLSNLLEYVDFVNVESIDYCNFYEKHTGSSAPLYSSKGYPDVNDTVSYYSRRSGDSKKLNLGLAFHGTYWNNVKDSAGNDGIRKLVNMKKGYMERGQVAYRKIEREGWSKRNCSWDEVSKTPYVYDEKNKRLLSFENRRSLEEKMVYAKDNGVGGITVWSLEMDDDKNTLSTTVAVNEFCT